MAATMFLFASILTAIFVCAFSIRRECDGLSDLFLRSGTETTHYRRMWRTYRHCTHVNGNLEITNLQRTHDLRFLKKIRYVNGYVVIAINNALRRIPLNKLKTIRGNRTVPIRGQEYSLVVSVNDRLVKLQMPKLQEISSGKVMFAGNPRLGYVNTIDWGSILRGHPENFVASNEGRGPFNASVADPSDTSICPGGHRWANRRSMCQADSGNRNCHSGCEGRCFGEGEDQCCHNTCAIGCTGPSDTECVECKDFKYRRRCMPYCPIASFSQLFCR